MSSKLAYSTLAKKDLILLYDISYPTLRRWLRRAGLDIFIGRKKLTAAELVLIFQHIGRPRLARSASQDLKDLFFQLRDMLSDEVRYKEKFGEEAPKFKQDLLPKSPHEVNHPSIYPPNKPSLPQTSLVADVLCRLHCIANKLLVRKMLKKQEQSTPLNIRQINKSAIELLSLKRVA